MWTFICRGMSMSTFDSQSGKLCVFRVHPYIDHVPPGSFSRCCKSSSIFKGGCYMNPTFPDVIGLLYRKPMGSNRWSIRQSFDPTEVVAFQKWWQLSCHCVGFFHVFFVVDSCQVVQNHIYIYIYTVHRSIYIYIYIGISIYIYIYHLVINGGVSIFLIFLVHITSIWFPSFPFDPDWEFWAAGLKKELTSCSGRSSGS